VRTFLLFFFHTAEFDGKDLAQDLNRLLHFSPGSQPNAAVLRECSVWCCLKVIIQLVKTVVRNHFYSHSDAY